MEFPQYTREENLSCKLSQEQIDDIPTLKLQWYSNTSIGRLYRVWCGTIAYWLKTEEQRKQEAKKRRMHWVKKYEFDPKKYRERKEELHPELIKYEIESTKKYQTINPKKAKDSKREASKKFRKNNPEIVKERRSKWVENNKEYIKEWNREYYREYMRTYRANKKLCQTI